MTEKIFYFEIFTIGEKIPCMKNVTDVSNNDK